MPTDYTAKDQFYHMMYSRQLLLWGSNTKVHTTQYFTNNNMASKPNNNKASTSKMAPTKKKPASKQKTKKNVVFASREVQNYAKLIADPCNGPLVRSVGSEIGTGIVERVRTTLVSPILVGNSCGYVAWFPSFHGVGTAINSPSNLYYWECTPANVALRPLNTVAVPMGAVAATSGTFYADPGSSTITLASPFSRARTIAACGTLEHIGQMSTVQGVVGSVVNISLASFNMAAGATANFTPPSVTDMINYAARRERLSVDGHEIVWAPNDRDSILRTNGQEDTGTLLGPSATDPNVAFWNGSAAAAPTTSANTDPNSCMGIVFVWQSVGNTGSGFININLTKVIELELAARSNTVEQRIAPNNTARGPLLSTIIESLDRNSPTWRTHAVRMAMSAGASISSAALAGTSFVANVSPAIMDMLR